MKHPQLGHFLCFLWVALPGSAAEAALQPALDLPRKVHCPAGWLLSNHDTGEAWVTWACIRNEDPFVDSMYIRFLSEIHAYAWSEEEEKKEKEKKRLPWPAWKPINLHVSFNSPRPAYHGEDPPDQPPEFQECPAIEPSLRKLAVPMRRG